MMRIKTYTSESVPQALKMIREELGPGAVILKTNRTVKKRFLGLFPSTAYEITAATDPSAGEKGPGEAAEEAVAGPLPGEEKVQKQSGAAIRETGQNPAEPKVKVRQKLETYEPSADPPAQARLIGSSGTNHSAGQTKSRGERSDAAWEQRLELLSQELQSLIRLVNRQRTGDAIASLFLRDATVARAMQELIWEGGPEGAAWRSVAFREFQRLLQEGIDEALAFSLIREVTQNLPVDDDIADRLRLRMNRTVERMIRVVPIDSKSSGVHLFVGPTGVGKTTTIAKLAARFALRDRRRVRLVTFDTYRIAAAEQLRTYGEIIGVPVQIAYSVDELNREIQDGSDGEITLIDTMGHSHRRMEGYAELAAFARSSATLTTHLVLSCSTQPEALREIIACFGIFQPACLLFTKLDEASRFGVIFNELMRNEKPLSYLTNGQDVAGDLIVPTARAVADLLVPIDVSADRS